MGAVLPRQGFFGNKKEKSALLSLLHLHCSLIFSRKARTKQLGRLTHRQPRKFLQKSLFDEEVRSNLGKFNTEVLSNLGAFLRF